MKKLLLAGAVMMAISAPAFAADYSGFVSPSSLGKSVDSLNKQYKVGLKYEKDYQGYKNSDSAACDLYVETDKKQLVKRIHISDKNDCKYTTKSNVNFNSASTTIKDLLNQVNISEVQFNPGCFNCPSRIEIGDNLVINRAGDKYYTEFEIAGDGEYHEFIIKKTYGSKYSEDKHYELMDELDEKDSKFFNRQDFKLAAIKTADMKSVPWNYTIIAK